MFAGVVLRVGSSFWLHPTLNTSPKPDLQKMLPCKHPCHTWDLGPVWRGKSRLPSSQRTAEIAQIDVTGLKTPCEAALEAQDWSSWTHSGNLISPSTKNVKTHGRSCARFVKKRNSDHYKFEKNHQNCFGLSIFNHVTKKSPKSLKKNLRTEIQLKHSLENNEIFKKHFFKERMQLIQHLTFLSQPTFNSSKR